MNEIAIDDLRRMLPESKTENPSDEYYLTLAQYIDKLLASMHVFPELDSSIRRRMVLDLTGYYQDIVSDAGLWRSFVKMNRFLYQRPVPFYKEPEDYVDSELNLIDVQFVAWYSLESQLGFLGLVSPFDSDLIRLSRQVYKLLAFLYDDAPVVENFKSLRELDLSDREQVRDIFKAYGWLFWNSYFMRPVSKHAYEQGVDAEDELSVDETLTDEKRLRTTLERPTGPLALLADEWMKLILEDRLPQQPKPAIGNHKYFQAMKAATGGDVVAFCRTYEELESFLADKMGWGKAEGGHLPQIKNFKNFVLYADSVKGLAVAHDVAQYVKHPANDAYDQTIAASEAHRLLMEPAKCPVDLLKYLFENGMVPDAGFPANKDIEMLQENWDFIARLYLRDFYRAD